MRAHSLAVLAAALPLLAAPAIAQTPPERVQRWLEDCRDRDWGDRERVCEVRTVAVARGTRALDVDGRNNGGVRVTGWDRDSIAVFALVQTQADGRTDAEQMAREIRIVAENGRIRTEAEPRDYRRSGYSVSYHILAPRGTDVTARTHNGGITIEGVSGRIDVAAHNGGVTIRDAAGDVRGRTMNGGISLALSGSRWNGRGVDLETRNGGVSLAIPENFNAELEASTVNGSFSVDFPVTVQGRIGRRLTTTLGRGGPPVRVATTNGSVRIRRM